jgi:hypothetical protein
MGNFWLKAKIWIKTTLFAVVFLYGLLFIYYNSGEQVHFWWWFGHAEQHSKLTFGLTAFLGGVIVTLLVRTTLGTMQQIRDLQNRSRQQKLERDLAEMKEKAARLQTRPIAAAPEVTGAAPVPGTTRSAP